MSEVNEDPQAAEPSPKVVSNRPSADEPGNSHESTATSDSGSQDIEETGRWEKEVEAGADAQATHEGQNEEDYPIQEAPSEDAFPAANGEVELAYEPDRTAVGKGKQADIVRPSPTIRISKELPDPPKDQDEVSVTNSSNPATLDTHSRAKSTATSISTGGPVSSRVFVVTALEVIEASKDGRRTKELREAVQAALKNVKEEEREIDPEIIFRPLQLASKTFSVPLQVTALDCIGKLISYSYFAFPSGDPPLAEDGTPQPPLIERAIEAICDCFENEATPVEIQQEIVKALLVAVLNDKIIVHGAGLLKAVRQIYNIFIYSKSSQNQQIAQGSLTQMVATVFDRVRQRLDLKEARMRRSPEARSDEDLSGEASVTADQDEDVSAEQDEKSEVNEVSNLTAPKDESGKMTLQSFENSQNMDDVVVTDSTPTMVTRARRERRIPRSISGAASRTNTHDEPDEADGSTEDEEDEIYIKDAFLVFRSLCKLSQKILTHDQQQDLRSQNMRSKLLSLHLIHHLLNNHISIFISPYALIKSGTNGETTAFMQVAKPHLCLSLSRNASSFVPRIFEVCCEIFWLSLKHLRVVLKKELEVFLKEVYLAVLEKKSAPLFQKQHFMDVLERLSADPRALVEIYLNYDCDRTALDNMYQGIIEDLAKISGTPISVTSAQQMQYQEQHPRMVKTGPDWHQKGSLLPGLSSANISTTSAPPPAIPAEYIMKQQSLECLIDILRSLDSWSTQGSESAIQYAGSRGSFEDSRDSMEGGSAVPPSPRIPSYTFETGASTPVAEDDPSEIEKVKLRKTALNDAIRQFNFKPKRGLKALMAQGFIKSESPEDIAQFLISNDRLDKAVLGDYLGEGDEASVAIMHAFVDTMDFTKRRFVDSLRQFLQSFRLPGEAQKIDRFMLKFAERYLAGNPNAFANADTAYVLAYSVIMLNTDQHSTKMKGRRMTPEDFTKNNRGINDSQDLPVEYLNGIYEEIANHEIVLASEREHAADMGVATSAPPTGLASRAGLVLAGVGRDLQKEKYAQASEEMANKTEQLYRSLIRAQKKSLSKEELSRFIPATSVKHIGPMFNVTWMSFLSGISGQIQTTQNLDIIRLCIEGLKLAIRVSCRFDLDTPRTAFVTALSKLTNLGNVREMTTKNLEALKALLEIALSEGEMLKGSWREILTCISMLDRFQLLSGGADEGALPDVSIARIPLPSNVGEGGRSRKSMQSVKRPRQRSANSTKSYRSEVAMETRSTDMVRGVDRIFTNTSTLSSEAIVDFVQALRDVSWQEIQSSGDSDSPRTYSLQKLVEISYYNMTRVRIEWTKIWEVLGEHFNQVGCHTNTAVVFFALDSLRQLSMRFMEIEELPGFKFQKDFLKPFEHVMANSNVVTVKDMILRCLIQMIQARGDNIRSGWKTMFGVFTVAAKESYEGIVNLALDYTTQIYHNRFGVVITQGAFADLIVCLTEFAKNLKFQKKSLQAIETLKSTVPTMLKTPECPLSNRRQGDVSVSGVKQPSPQSEEEQFWYPVLIAYQDILMTGEDLEVRSRALTYLFETLVRYGGDFPTDFWDVLWRQLLYPIFVVLQSKSEMSKAPNHEELSVWLSTTMIQALRNMITLFTHYFDSLQHMLDRFLDLLILCICQENDTIARIGSNCLQQLILQNVTKFNSDHWSKIVGAFVGLFDRTTAYELFSAAATMSQARTPSITAESNTNGLAIEPTSPEIQPQTISVAADDPALNPASPAPLNTPSQPIDSSLPPTLSPTLESYRPAGIDTQSQAPVVTHARRRFFNRIITNCVLQLLMIETVAELFSNEAVYTSIPSPQLLLLMSLLRKSYQFARKFNGDKELRMALWKQGFMKQPPNLLKQESQSAGTYVSILLRMYHDEGEEKRASRERTEDALIPLCAEILRSFSSLSPTAQSRNIAAWRPTVAETLVGVASFPADAFERHIATFYPLVVGLVDAESGLGLGGSAQGGSGSGSGEGGELRAGVAGYLRRVGEVRFNLDFGPSKSGIGSLVASPEVERGGMEWEGGGKQQREVEKGE